MKVKSYLSLIKFSHTIFALPFAMVGFFLAYILNERVFYPKVFLLIILCMVFARSAAMAFNRYLDRDIDLKNPRTNKREIPSGEISSKGALIFVILMSTAFIGSTFFINSLVFYLSPIALAVILGYSYTKRFTALCHLVLGLGLALAPLGAYLAYTGSFHPIPILFSLVVLFWVAGFDIIYALQDSYFDKQVNLHSIPVLHGKANAIKFSETLHIVSALILIVSGVQLFYYEIGFSYLLGLGTILFVGLLYYQHHILDYNTLSNIDISFFTTNGIASIVYGTCFILDIYF